jgi:tetratricopeptide (TPR) repeat protein
VLHVKNKEELDSKATYLIEKAKQLLDEGKRNKAMKNFIEAADLYETIARMDAGSWQAAWKLVMEYLITTARLLVEDEQYMSAARIQRRLGTVALNLKDAVLAADYFNVSAKFALKDAKPDPVLILHVSTMYSFLTYLQAEYEKSTDFLKKILGMFNTEKVNNSHVYSILRDFYKPGLDKKLSKITMNETDLYKDGFSTEEIQFINAAINVRALLDDSMFTFSLDAPRSDTGYVAGDEIIARLGIKIVTNEFIKAMKCKIQVKSISVEKSSDLTQVTNYLVPASVPASGIVNLQETFRSYHAGDNQIGPLSIELLVGDFISRKKVDGIKFNIHGRPVNMIIACEKIQEPLVGKPFPLRIDITNESRGDASNVDVEVDLPGEQQGLQLVRGTLKKKFLAMAGGESGSWEIQLLPAQEGTAFVKVTVNYKDASGRQAIPVIHEEVIEIKM